MSKTNELLLDLSEQALRCGLTVPQLAKLAGVAPNSLRGMRPITKWSPSIRTLRQLEKALAKVNGRK